jgi:hypothetical protein
MFYQPYVDITKDKSMFNFLKDHYKYYTGNSWNRTRSIANNVKLYKLGLSGDWCTTLKLLEDDDYDMINDMIRDWESSHPGYSVGFNGRSGGYLVLYNRAGSQSILPETLDYDSYEDYKADMKDYYGSVKANRDELVYYTKLVRDFDKLCDELRDYCDELSKLDYEIVTTRRIIDTFNDAYAEDLEFLEIEPLECNKEGIVDITNILDLRCLSQAFYRLAGHSSGYKFKEVGDGLVKLQQS